MWQSKTLYYVCVCVCVCVCVNLSLDSTDTDPIVLGEGASGGVMVSKLD